jgi:hypothetical protein
MGGIGITYIHVEPLTMYVARFQKPNVRWTWNPRDVCLSWFLCVALAGMATRVPEGIVIAVNSNEASDAADTRLLFFDHVEGNSQG